MYAAIGRVSIEGTTMKKITFAALFIAFAAGSASAGETGIITQAAESKVATTAAKQGTGGSPLTLYIKDSAGNPLRLVHAPGVGWKYAAGWESAEPAGDSMLVKTAFSPTTPQSEDAPVPAEEPLTVFIDGPTGFTYVWIRDEGWKFAGHLSHANR